MPQQINFKPYVHKFKSQETLTVFENWNVILNAQHQHLWELAVLNT